MSRYFGFAKESTYGTPNTTAEMYLNAGKCTLDAPDDPTIEVPSFEETPSDVKAGLYSPSGDVELALDIHSIMPILYFAFGQYKFTEGATSSDPNIHEIWAAGCHRLPSFTAMVGKGDCGNTDEEFEHQFYGCVISKLSFALSNGLATCTASIQGQRDAPAEIQTVDLEEICPIAFHEAETTLDNEDITADTTSFNFDFDNNVKPEDGQVFGTMFPDSLTSNGKSPSVTTELKYRGKKYLVKFWGGQNGPTKQSSYFDYHIDFTDVDGNTLQLYFPRCRFKSTPTPIEGTDAIKTNVSLAILKGEVTLNDDETKVRTSCLATITSKDSAYISA